MPLTTPLHPLSKEVADQLREQFRRMLVRLDEIRAQTPAPSAWLPAVDLGELEDFILVRVELPGVLPDQVRLTLLDQSLKVEGRKERPAPAGSLTTESDRPVRFICLERGYGSFAFTISLKWQIDIDGISARMADGILEVRLPKAAHCGREIAIPIQQS